MAEPPTTTHEAAARKRVLPAVAAVVLAAAGAGVAAWTAACPCDTTPGFVLLGETQGEAVADWSFANSVPLCQIQVYAAWRPHAVNLNCMATTEGELFLSCSSCDTKYWARQVGPGESARLRLDGRVYPVVLSRVVDASVLDRAWAARVRKLQALNDPANPAPDANAARPESWGSFWVRSRSTGAL